MRPRAQVGLFLSKKVKATSDTCQMSKISATAVRRRCWLKAAFHDTDVHPCEDRRVDVGVSGESDSGFSRLENCSCGAVQMRMDVFLSGLRHGLTVSIH